MIKINLASHLITFLLLTCNMAQASDSLSEDQTLFNKHIHILSRYPDINHQLITRSFQDAFKHYTQEIEASDIHLKTLETDLQKLKKQIDPLKQSIAQKLTVIKTYNDVLELWATTEAGKQNLLNCLRAEIQSHDKIVYDTIAGSAEQKLQIKIAMQYIENYETQIKILEQPLESSQHDLANLQQQLKNLEDNIRKASHLKIAATDRKISHQVLREKLINLRAKSIYDRKHLGFLEASDGYLFATSYPQLILTKLLNLSEVPLGIKALSKRRLWKHFIKHIELPDPLFHENLDHNNIQDYYQQQLNALIKQTDLCARQEAFNLSTLCKRFVAYNSHVDDGHKLVFNTEESERREIQIYARLTKRDINDLPRMPKASQAKISLKELFSDYEISIDEIFMTGFLSTRLNLLGHLLTSLEYGPYYSWDPNSLILRTTQQKLKQGVDTSADIMYCFYRMIGFTVNKQALQTILEHL